MFNCPTVFKVVEPNERSQTERQILYHITYIRNPKEKLRETEGRMMVAWGWGVGKMEIH